MFYTDLKSSFLLLLREDGGSALSYNDLRHYGTDVIAQASAMFTIAWIWIISLQALTQMYYLAA
ncbi:MAG: hypothetical protein V7776_18425 [Halopseudomonas aestusnigri]